MNTPLTVTPTKAQLLMGLIYLPVEMLLLPPVLSLGIGLLEQLTGFSVTLGQFNGIYFAINFLAVLLIFHKFLLRELRRCKGRLAVLLKTAAAGFVIYMAANFLVTQVIAYLDPDFGNVNDAAIARMAAGDYWIIFLGTVFLVPVTEELLFRGVLFAGFHNRSPLAAYLLSTLVFSMVHVIGYIGQYPAATLLLCLLQYIAPSLCLCWAYAKSDSFLTPVIIHTTVNAIGIFSMR